MNKIFWIAKSLLIGMGIVNAAYAEAGVDYSLLNNWTGFYVGINSGVSLNNTNLSSQQLGFTDPGENCNNNSDFATFAQGIQFGYLYQFPNSLVSGIEGNITVNAPQKNNLTCNCATNSDISDNFSFRNKMQSSVKARVGGTLSWNENIVLPYLTAGASFASLGLTYQNEGTDYYSKNITQGGWLIGAGIEWAFMENWSLRLEYSYINYGNAIQLKIPSVYGLLDPNGNAHVNLNSNNLTLAINYWM